MQNTKLIKLLRTFSETEIRKFREFVNSPYFNKNKHVVSLAENILKYHPGFENKKLNEENIFKSVYKNESYDYYKLKNIISDLLSLAMMFLRYQPVYFTEFIPEINLIVNLRSRRLLELHEKAVSAGEKKLESGKIKDGIYLYNKFILADEKQISDAIKKPNSNKGLQNVFNSQFELSLLNLLKQYSLLTHVSIENNIEFDLKMLSEVLEFIRKNERYENITVKAYRFITLLLSDKDVKYYEGLKNIYFNHYESLDIEDLYMVLFYLNGFCAERYNIGSDKKYIYELRDLFKYAFEMDAVALGTFHYPDYVHYMKIFIRAGDFETAEKFKHKYFGRITDEQKSNAENHISALTEYKKKNYEQALYYISRVNYPSFIMKLQVKLIHLQLLIETGNFEEARAAIHSFKQFLLRETTISKAYKSVISKFLKLSFELIKIYEFNDKKKLGEFKHSAEKLEANHFGIRLWLLEKCN
jgi:hypothetical protein